MSSQRADFSVLCVRAALANQRHNGKKKERILQSGEWWTEAVTTQEIGPLRPWATQRGKTLSWIFPWETVYVTHFGSFWRAHFHRWNMGQYLSWWTIVMIVRGWLGAHWGPRTYCLLSSDGRTSMLPCYMHTARGISDRQHARLRLNRWKADLGNLPTLPRETFACEGSQSSWCWRGSVAST